MSEPEPRGDISTAIKWLSGQPFNNVLVMILISMVGWLGYYSITTAIPAHLKQIQDGYERIEAIHERHLKMLIDSNGNGRNGDKNGGTP